MKGPSILRSVPRKHSPLSVDLCDGHKPAAMHSPGALQARVTEPAGEGSVLVSLGYLRHLRHGFRAIEDGEMESVKWS